ncbi:MAG: hypothetical protein EOP24_38130 [Hyphomicrobiales bacterium]|nr:MAG: hypothetical protein EOP24_38130 [Hyphomicrobiales bacterium]
MTTSSFKGRGQVDSLDRIRFRLDGPIPKSSLERLAVFCREVVLTPTVIEFQPRWTYDLDVLQPHPAVFCLALEDALPAGTSFELYYLEIARDYLTQYQIEAYRMARHFVGHASLRYSRGDVEKIGTRYYYNPVGAPLRLVVYGDRPTKQFSTTFGRPACHTELRLEGAETLARQGIRGARDLAQLPYNRIWKRNLSLWTLPSQTTIGTAVGCRSSRKDSLQRAAREALADKSTYAEDTFVLQKFFTQHPALKRQSKPLSYNEWKTAARNFSYFPAWFSER